MHWRSVVVSGQILNFVTFIHVRESSLFDALLSKPIDNSFMIVYFALLYFFLSFLQCLRLLLLFLLHLDLFCLCELLLLVCSKQNFDSCFHIFNK